MQIHESKKSIGVSIENINNPEDIEEFTSINAAMKKYKKSYKVIKRYIENNMTINGYRWFSKKKYTKNNELVEHTCVITPDDSVSEETNTTEILNNNTEIDNYEKLELDIDIDNVEDLAHIDTEVPLTLSPTVFDINITEPLIIASKPIKIPRKQCMCSIM